MVIVNLLFEHPELVSAEYKEDKIYIHPHIRENVFVGRGSFVGLHPYFKYLKHRIPK